VSMVYLSEPLLLALWLADGDRITLSAPSCGLRCTVGCWPMKPRLRSERGPTPFCFFHFPSIKENSYKMVKTPKIVINKINLLKI
jgi:hypothetical protein